MDKKLPIGVFDSGIGGLTVFKELRKALPVEDLIYFGDTARTPYGSRPQEQIRQFVDEILAFMAHNRVKLAVAACNSITVLGLNTLRKDHPFMMLGVNTGARVALQASKNKRIGVAATKTTVHSRYHEQAIRHADPEAVVLGQACPLLAPLVEMEHFDDILAEEAVKEYACPLQESGVDTVILACTHYPFLTPVFRKNFGPDVTIINPARETALEALGMLSDTGLLRTEGTGTSRICFSADLPRAERITRRIIDDAACQFELVKLAEYQAGLSQ